MKQLYESEVLYKLMEREGILNPSSVPPYESEIKQYFIEQIKLAYPKLTDYEAEWLLYNYIEYIPADFPIESALNVTQCKIDNVVPYAYQSAILKGNTLVNLIRTIGKTILGQYQDVVSLIHVKPSTKYLLKIKNNTSEAKSFYSSEITEWTQIDIEANQTITKTLTTKSTLGRNTLLQNAKTHTTEHDLSIIFIEYQDGMENWDIPYFEGMKSVKMPVLTTTGKNLFGICEFEKGVAGGFPNTNVTITNNSVSLGELGASVAIKLKGKPNTKYTISFIVNNTSTMNLREWNNRTQTTDVNGEVTWNYGSYNPNTNNGRYKLENIQIEEGSTATSYEPYKSNILNTSEDVTLRGIEDVQDTLDCLTGEVTERIGEIVLDGSENWNTSITNYNNDTAVFYLQSYFGANTIQVMDKFTAFEGSATQFWGTSTNNKENHVNNNNDLAIRIYKSRLSTVDIDGFKQWLSQNPVTVQYQLATESIKTVDLNITNQDGEECYFMPIEGTMHMATNGQPIKPLLDVEVPVEAITQNLASFINMKMNDEGE